MTNTEEDDEALVGRYARGDAAAFDQLYRRYELPVWRYLEHNMRSQAASDDLLQEIWFALARNAASLESATRFRTQLFTLAHDRMTDSLRARAAKASPAAAASRPAVAHDPANALPQAIGQLPSKQREAYLLQIEGQFSLSALDPGRPGEWVRRKVQAYAAQQAAERAVRASAKAKESTRSEAPTSRATAIPAAAKQTANKPWLLPVTFGAIAAAALVGFLVVPSLMAPRDSPKPALSPAPVSQPEAAASQVAQASPPHSSESVSPETATPQVAQASAPHPSESVSPPPPSPPLQSSAPASPTSPPPVQQSPAQTPVAPRSSEPLASVVASRSAGTSPAQSLTRARVAHQNAAVRQSTPIASNHANITTQGARPGPPADSAPAPQIPPVPSKDTEVGSAPTPPGATLSATQPAPTPAAAASTPPDELWLAAKSGDMTGLQAALAGNVDVNALDAKGQTALILAIQNNHVDIVRALLAHGANPNTPDSRGFTPLRAARMRANFAILTALERNGRH